MKHKYEIAELNDGKVTVDVSLLAKTDEMYFNATEIAKKYGKRPNDFWRDKQNTEYLEALVTTTECNENDFIKTKRGGKYQGTWFHKDLALQFARWLSPVFAVCLDKWIKSRIEQERDWKQKRLEAKTGFLPLTNAVLEAHDPVKHYHFSNEADMINRIVLGVSASQFREDNEVANVRDALDAAQLSEINRLQIINTGLIEIGMDYKERKEKILECHKRTLKQLGYEE